MLGPGALSEYLQRVESSPSFGGSTSPAITSTLEVLELTLWWFLGEIEADLPAEQCWFSLPLPAEGWYACRSLASHFTGKRRSLLMVDWNLKWPARCHHLSTAFPGLPACFSPLEAVLTCLHPMHQTNMRMYAVLFPDIEEKLNSQVNIPETKLLIGKAATYARTSAEGGVKSSSEVTPCFWWAVASQYVHAFHYSKLGEY